MSFEGHEQVICENGHYSVRPTFEDEGPCPDCGGETAWANVVDETNCDGFNDIDIEQFLSAPAVWGWRFVWRKMTKGFVRVEKSPEIYRIPTPEETIRAMTYRHCGVRVPVYETEEDVQKALKRATKESEQWEWAIITTQVMEELGDGWNLDLCINTPSGDRESRVSCYPDPMSPAVGFRPIGPKVEVATSPMGSSLEFVARDAREIAVAVRRAT